MKKYIPLLIAFVMLIYLLPLGVQAADYVVDEVHLKVEQPVAGYTPRFQAWIDEVNPNYYISTAAKTNFINGISWKDETTGQYLDEDDTFIQGHSYTVAIRCDTNTVYDFNVQIASNNVSAYYFADGYVNGSRGVIGVGTFVSQANQKATVYYTFENCEAAPAPITQVSVAGIKTPHHLDAPDFDAAVAGNKYRVAADKSATLQRSFYNGVGWCQNLGNGYIYTMDTDDTFTGGKIYRVSVLLEAVHPYRFAVDAQGQPQMSGTVKGYPATVRDTYGYLDSSRYCIVEYEFPVASLNNYCIINEVSITDIDTPLPGRCPDYTANTVTGAYFREMDSLYVKDGIAWYDETTGTYLKPTDTFVAGHIYTVMVNLQSAENYLFKDDEYGNWVTTATINGQSAVVANERLGVDKFRADYTFAACQVCSIDQVDITVQAPVLGAEASYDVSIAQAGITTQDRNDGYFKNGVAWLDNQENTYLLPGQRFAPGRSYNLELYLQPETGYTIAGGVSVKVNGVTADAWGSGNNVWVTCATPELEYAIGWYEYDGQKMYWKEDGTLHIGWMKLGENWYFFDGTGTMATGWVKDNGKEYYLGTDGVMVTGWVKQSGIWYYLKPGSGDMAVGWMTINGKTYYFKSNGRMVTGSVEIDGKRYQFDANGALVDTSKQGWVKESGNWYYYENGGKVSGWKQVGGKWYYLDAAGVMKTGWQRINNVWYFLNNSGAMVTGWLQQGSTWYYLNSSGAMATGWLQVNGVWYYFNGSGTMATGWLRVNGVWYYFNTSGAMVTGWLKLGDTWYYFHSSGAMATGSVTIGSKTYHFSTSGACLNP